MKKMNKKFAAALAVVLGIGVSSTTFAVPVFGPNSQSASNRMYAQPAYAQTTGAMQSNIIVTNQGGEINWEGGNVQAMGIGIVPPTAKVKAQRRALARRAAMVDAYRYLAETVQGVNVSGDTTVIDMMTANDTVKTQVNACIKGARILDEGMQDDGESYYVILSIPLHGASSIASAVMPSVQPPSDASAFTDLSPVPPYDSAPAPTTPESAPGYAQAPAAPIAVGYTGVIIDARGMGLVPTFSPAIYDSNGRGIYGTANVSSEIAISKGMVAYAKDLESAAVRSRAGQNPLIIQASGIRAGAGGIGNAVNVVVTPEQGNQILAENAKSGMLNNCAVVFVR